jgi:LacI family transcriptional regulator
MHSPPARPIRIGLVFDRSLDYCRGVLRGVKRFAETKPRWTFVLVAPEAQELEDLARLRPSGLIAHVFSKHLAAVLRGWRKPMVNVSGVVPRLRIPTVLSDDAAIGQLTARHLLERGFRNFAFVGNPNFAYAIKQETAFRQIIEAAGHEVSHLYDRSERSFHPHGRLWAFDVRIRSWLQSLSTPIGIFASNDLWGVQLTEACHEVGLRVPEDVAVVGVDNDNLMCELSRPSLSSVAIPSEQVGYEAAALLDRLLEGVPAPKVPRLLPPLGIVTRQSSDILAVTDADVASAIRFIRDRAHLPTGVKDVLREVPVGRRSFERRFRHVLRRGISEEIRRVHLERAKTLLATTRLPIAVVAHQAGFSENKHLSVVFAKEFGLSPTAYRQQVQGAP